MRLPKTIGTAIDHRVTLRDERLELEAKAKDLKAKEAEFDLHIVKLLREKNTTSARSKHGHIATIQLQDIPVVENWDAFFEWMVDNDASDCVQKRPGQGAIRDRVEAGAAPPKGIKFEQKVKISLTKSRS